MKAIIYRRHGGPEVIELADVEPPKVHVTTPSWSGSEPPP
jgi:NADPH:quinone reductase-like Zn-dependent oxidoreductase